MPLSFKIPQQRTEIETVFCRAVKAKGTTAKEM